MTLLGICSILARFLGFAEWADALWVKHQSKVNQQEIADVPLTNQEEADDLRK
jgi:hypothetical protein